MVRIASLAVLLCAAVVTVKGDVCATHANGCSIPFGWTFFYKTLFTTACNRHDVCYGCGATHGLSKASCDSAFLRDMDAACHASGRRRSIQQRSVCTTTAQDVYYAAVHYFGSSHFSGPGHTASYCSQSWVRSCLP
ncbi:conodipine-P3-like [Littorina saxatilis]|uniref:Conodipine n=1 Tax=Littorina saxatilis TaxID=31220 RepID=A0AAN9BXZ4_9CAEN